MRNPDNPNDSSMEDILASIRKMISEEPAPSQPAAPAIKAEPAANLVSKPQSPFEPAATQAKSAAFTAAPDPTEADDDLADLLTSDDGGREGITLPTTGFMAPAPTASSSSAFPAAPAMLNPVGVPVQPKSGWGLKRDSFIPVNDRATPVFSNADGALGNAAPFKGLDAAEASTADASGPLANTGDFGSIVPGSFGRRDMPPPASSPFNGFPKPPLRLKSETAPEVSPPSAAMPVLANGLSTNPASEETNSEKARPERPLTSDSELAALVGQVFERRDPSIAQVTVTAPVPAPPFELPASGLQNGVVERPVRSTSSLRQEPSFEPFAGSPPTGAHAYAPSRTLEDVVGELLRPMLKTWLDANMPRMLEAALRKEAGFGEPGDQDKS